MPFGEAELSDLLSIEEWNNLVDLIIDAATFRVKIKKLFPFELINSNYIHLSENSMNRKQSFNCGSATNKVYIYPDFSVYPCTCLTDFRLGNVLENTIEEILMMEPANIFRTYKVLPGTPCENCTYLRYCNGGCIGMSYHYFGALGKGDIRCPIVRSNNETCILC